MNCTTPFKRHQPLELDINELESALHWLDAHDRNQWIAVGAALATLGEQGFALWDAWSQTAGNYDPRVMASTWKSLRGTRSHYKAIFKMAHNQGWTPSRESTPRPIPVPSARSEPKSGVNWDRIRQSWKEALTLDHPQAEIARAYLENRGLGSILMDLPDNLRFHPAHWFADDKGKHPALLARVQDTEGNLCALHQTYLTEQGEKLCDSAKRVWGKLPAGCAIRLYPHTKGHPIAIAEGIETALACRIGLDWEEVCPNVWCVISAGNMTKFEPPPDTTRIDILADHDASGAGMKSAQALRARAPIPARIFMPPEQGTDWLDYLAALGWL